MNNYPNVLPPHEDAEINMTSMLDVVFIMLIFFIVSTSFTREAGIDVERPSASSATDKTSTSVLIAINEQGDIWLDRKATDLRMVRATLERLKTQQQLSVVVQADINSRTGDLVNLIDQLRLAKVKYSVAAKKQP